MLEIHEQSCRENGTTAKPRECFETLLGGAQRAGRLLNYVARLDGKVIGALLVVLGPQTASYYTLCTDPEYRTFQAGPLLIDRAMDDALALGLRYWNWEASPGPDSGVYKFKK